MNALKKETEELIITAAKEVFIEKGLQGARMQEIADQAGINKALLHYYYRSKDHLFDAVFETIALKLFSGFKELFDANDMNDIAIFFPKFIKFYNNIFLENPHLPQFFFHEIWQHPDKLAAIIRSQDIKPEEILQKISSHAPAIEGYQYSAQHMVANVMGMLLFPHIGRPLFQRIFFNNDDNSYNQFLSERSDFLIQLLGNVFENYNTENNDPDEDF